MTRSLRLVTIIAGAALAATSMAAPAAALDTPTATVSVEVQVVGYVAPGFEPLGGRLSCGSLGGPLDFEVGAGAGPLSSGPLLVPAPTGCSVGEMQLGDPGPLGSWDNWWTAGAVFLQAGESATIHVTVERSYNGNQPEWDGGTWFPMEVFTVDKVWLDRWGGVSAEGLAWCPSLAASPVGPDPIIGINWDAIQYVGRRTAIHGSYGSDIGKNCFDPAHPTTPLRWTSMHMGLQEPTRAWVYGVDGRFGSGTIRIEADSYNDMSQVTQWWDPNGEGYSAACSTTDPNGNGRVDTGEWFDANGDGFCAYSIESGQRTIANLRTTTWRSR